MKTFIIVSMLLVAQEGAEQSAASNATIEIGKDYLNLICMGVGSASKQDNTTVYGNTIEERANVVGRKTVPFEEQVNVRFNEAQSWLRMPQIMLPTLRGGNSGWFKIKSLDFGEEEIKGKIAINAINRPTLRIDRITGEISINGRAGNYSGKCIKYDPDTVKKAF